MVEQSVKDIEAQEKAPVSSGTGLKLTGRFARYTSPFWQIVLPFLSARYLFEALDSLTDLSHKIRNWNPTEAQLVEKAEKAKVLIAERDATPLYKKLRDSGHGNWVGGARWLSTNITTFAFGGAIAAIIAYYTKHTYGDIKKLYTQAVGYEMDKPADKVSFFDLRNSKNEIVSTTMKALVKRTSLRLSAAGSFFVPWGPLAREKYKNTNQLDEVGLRMGAGIMGFYLFSDGFLRKQSFFEATQDLVDKKINHAEGNFDEIISTNDVARLMVLQKATANKSYQPPQRNSAEWQDELKVAGHIADLFNRTYNNTPGGTADFTIAKFIFLSGNGYLAKYPESIAYVDLASKSQDMKEVKDVAAAIKSGANPAEAFAKYGVDVSALVATHQTQPEAQAQTPEAEVETPKLADKIQPAQSRIPQAPRTPQEFAAQNNGAGLTP